MTVYAHDFKSGDTVKLRIERIDGDHVYGTVLSAKTTEHVGKRVRLMTMKGMVVNEAYNFIVAGRQI
jgi:hypothetical protein